MNNLRQIKLSPSIMVVIAAIILVASIGFYKIKTKSPTVDTVSTPAAEQIVQPSTGVTPVSGKCTTVFSNVKTVNENGLVTLESGETYNPGVPMQVGQYVSYTYCQ